MDENSAGSGTPPSPVQPSVAPNPPVPGPVQAPQSTPMPDNFSQPITTTEATPAPQPQYQEIETPKKSRGLLLAILLIIFLVLFTAVAGGVYVVAYEKIDIGNDEVQSSVGNFVMSLPFTPKTSKYILGRMYIAQSEVSKHSFDVSAAFDTNDLLSDIGLTNFDFATKGKIDYSDRENITFQVEIDLTEGVNVELRKVDSSLYFNIKKVPQTLLSLAGIDANKLSGLLNIWVSHDLSDLESSAREELEEYKSENGKEKFDIPDEVFEIFSTRNIIYEQEYNLKCFPQSVIIRHKFIRC